jgi:Pentapeptide repeats (8 copies)
MTDKPGADESTSPLLEIVRNRRPLWRTGAAVVLAALLIVILWKVPQWQVGHYSGLTSSQWFDHVNEARKTLATILGGLVVLAGAYFTWRNIKLTQESVATAQRALMVSQEGQITDRFTKAIEQLGAVDANGKKKLEVRLGAIYALERIANQSERDHWPIMEVLSAYVRENASRILLEILDESQKSARLDIMAEDIQAILTVLGRRDRRYRQEDQDLNLFRVYIHGAYLPRANFSRANLMYTNISAAYLGDADLSKAKFRGANLSEAFLYRANLREADLLEANLSKARIHGADFRDALNLTQLQLDEAEGDQTTRLPGHLKPPERWAKSDATAIRG